MSSTRFRLVLCLALATSGLFGRGKPKPVAKDSFDVVGHMVLDGRAVTGIVVTNHFSRNYLYAESSSSHSVMVIDVTDCAHPKVLSSVNGSGSLITAAGDVALVSSEPAAPASPVRTVSIVDFSDKANPKVTREFAGVTSMTPDTSRGLVFLANGEGLWILHRNQPVDPEIEERYAHTVVYQ